MRRTALVAATSVLFLVGCTTSPTTTSTDDFEGEERKVAQTVADLAEAGSAREATDICGGVVADDLRETIAQGGSTCNDEMQKALEDVDGFDLEVKDVTVTGDEATAQVESADRDRRVRRTFRFVRVDGDWRISSFG
jgi:pyruvate-formate lyase-activating enzyme